MAELTFHPEALDRWEEYYERLDDAGPYHEPGYVRLVQDYLGGPEHAAELFVYEDDDGFVYYPYYARTLDSLPFAEASSVDTASYRDLVSSWYYGGPLASPGATEATVRGFREAFASHCVETNVVAEFVRFDPNVGNHETFAGVDPEFDRETVPVDLTLTEEALWDGFEKRNRNAIRQGQDSDLVVEPASERADWRAFHDIYTDAMEARDASAHYRFPFEFFDRLREREGRSTLLVARDGDAVVGGALVVHDGEIAHDYLRASNPEYWDQRVNNLLCYEALMHAREQGHRCFDFQGGRPGVFKFKKAFSPLRREFHLGTDVHLPEVYDRLLEDAESAGVDTDTDYFPAYRVAQSN